MSSNLPILSSVEKILESLFQDCKKIKKSNGFNTDLAVIRRQFETVDEYRSSSLFIDSGVQYQDEQLLKDLTRRTMTVIIAGQVSDPTINPDGTRTVVTSTNLLMDDVKKAVLQNSRRTVSGVDQAYNTSLAEVEETIYPPEGSFLMAVQVVFYEAN